MDSAAQCALFLARIRFISVAALNSAVTNALQNVWYLWLLFSLTRARRTLTLAVRIQAFEVGSSGPSSRASLWF